jgi:hypothetical protein
VTATWGGEATKLGGRSSAEGSAASPFKKFQAEPDASSPEASATGCRMSAANNTARHKNPPDGLPDSNWILLKDNGKCLPGALGLASAMMTELSVIGNSYAVLIFITAR